MASYTVNEDAVAHARRLIDAHRYVLESVWGDAQPSADDENAFLKAHSWDEYAAWHLGLTDGANDDTKARYAFVYGDFRRVHRIGPGLELGADGLVPGALPHARTRQPEHLPIEVHRRLEVARGQRHEVDAGDDRCLGGHPLLLSSARRYLGA